MAERTDIATVDELHASATKLTGLDDFGVDDDNYREALSVLLDSYRQEAGLTVLGSKMNRFFLRGALVARLLSESAWKQYPQHAEVAVKRPIFVTGLVRTGTTALHRQLDAQFTQHHQDNPGYTGLHFMAAYELEECWQLLRQSLHSVSYETLAHLPSYSKWLAQQDWTPAYQRHRKNLQLIGLNDADKRWVLKNPSHLFALDALMKTYPDALVIQTHRPVDTIMASMCSLAQHTAEGWSTKFVGVQIGADAMETWSRGLEQFNSARAKYNPAQFYDVDYRELITDPLGTVTDIYRQFDIPLTDEARQAVKDSHAESQTGARAPKHAYSLADYGLTAEAVKERFAGL